MEHNYRISYHVGNTGFEIESNDKEWFDKKEKEFLLKITDRLNRNINLTENELPISISKGSIPVNITIDEFYKKYIKSLKIISRPLMAVFFVYYLSKIENKDSIKTLDVSDCFAKISYPNYYHLNMTDILNKAKHKAFLNNVNNQWSLTLTGEDYVLNSITNPVK